MTLLQGQQLPAERLSAESIGSAAGEFGGARGGAVAALRASTSSQNSPDVGRSLQVSASSAHFMAHLTHFVNYESMRLQSAGLSIQVGASCASVHGPHLTLLELSGLEHASPKRRVEC